MRVCVHVCLRRSQSEMQLWRFIWLATRTVVPTADLYPFFLRHVVPRPCC